MSTYELSQLLKLWAMEQISLEQAIGQILLHLQGLADRVKELERQGNNIGGEVSSDSAQ